MSVIHDPYVKIVTINNLRRIQAGLLPINGTHYNPDDPVPSPYASKPGNANTFLKLVPIGSGPVIEIYYDRVDLSEAAFIEVTKGAATDISGLLPQLSEALGVVCTIDDFENIPLPNTPAFILTASLTNMAFLPGTTTEITFTV